MYVFKTLPTSNFFRFILTVLLDMFISDPLFKIMMTYANPMRKILTIEGANPTDTKVAFKVNQNEIEMLPTEGKGLNSSYSRFMSENLDTIVQSIVAVITFQAYTNDTRFNWAYPSVNVPKEKRISKYTMMLMVVVSAIVYLTASPVSVSNDTVTQDVLGIAQHKSKLVKVLFTIIMLTCGNMMGALEAPDVKNTRSQGYKTPMGLGMFVAFVVYGILIPIQSGTTGNADNDTRTAQSAPATQPAPATQ